MCSYAPATMKVKLREKAQMRVVAVESETYSHWLEITDGAAHREPIP